jgi:large subunit ribosomal protein L30
MSSLRITLLKSPIGYAERQKRTVRALGLGRLHQTVERPDNPQTRGMVRAVKHLVKVEYVSEGDSIVETDAGTAETGVEVPNAD